MTRKHMNTCNSWRSDLRDEMAPPSGGTANAALNAHSFGLPVIATDVGSLRNDTMETNGISLPGKSPADL
jgi:hypothetical protein